MCRLSRITRESVEKNHSHTATLGVAEALGADSLHKHVYGGDRADLLEGSTDTAWERSPILDLQRDSEKCDI